MSTPGAIDAQPLRAALTGAVLTPADPGWVEACRPWNLLTEQRPALTVLAGSAADIAATVRFAAAHGLRVAPQATGHSAGSLGPLSDAILLRTGRLNGVRVDPVSRSAHGQAGARWRDVVGPSAEHGLVALHGFSGGVGVAGYTLGGGIGWLARREGFASTHVRSFEVVTADGRELHVDAEQEPDLFWALRGGGGGPAIVTSFELGLFPLPQAYAGSLMWPIAQAPDVAHAYLEWVQSLPACVTATLRLMRFPAAPAVPEPLRGQAMAVITLACAEPGRGESLVAPLRALPTPALDLLGPVPGAALAEISGDPQDPMPALGGSCLLERLEPGAIDALLELAGPDADCPLTALEIRHLGGALSSPVADPGAAGALPSAAIVFATGVPVSPAVGEALQATLAQVSRRFAPFVGARRTLLTFDDWSPGLRGLLPDVAVDRLAAVTAAYDPDGRLIANHAVS